MSIFPIVKKLKSQKKFQRKIKRKAFYFLHTYKFFPKNKKLIKAVCKSQKRIVAIIKQDNLYGVQFHPEKSGQAGKKLIKNFLNA